MFGVVDTLNAQTTMMKDRAGSVITRPPVISAFCSGAEDFDAFFKI